MELSPREGGTRLELRVKPGARRSAIVGVHGGALTVAVPAAPEKGKANRAVLDLLGELVRVHLANHGMVKTASESLGAFLMYRYTFSTSLDPIDFSDPPDRFLARFRDIFGREFSAADRARLEVIDEWDGKNWHPRRIGTKNGQNNPPAPRKQQSLP